MSFVTRPFELRSNKMRDAFGYVASAVATIAIVLPPASFALVSFVRKYPVDMSFTLDNIGRSLNLNVGDYWLNSIFHRGGGLGVGHRARVFRGLHHGSHGW